MSETLLTCPVCQQRGFTARGLRAHVCRGKTPKPGSLSKGAPLSQAEYQGAVLGARQPVITPSEECPDIVAWAVANCERMAALGAHPAPAEPAKPPRGKKDHAPGAGTSRGLVFARQFRVLAASGKPFTALDFTGCQSGTVLSNLSRMAKLGRVTVVKRGFVGRRYPGESYPETVYQGGVA